MSQGGERVRRINGDIENTIGEPDTPLVEAARWPWEYKGALGVEAFRFPPVCGALGSGRGVPD